jgi:hypothetical protein
MRNIIQPVLIGCLLAAGVARSAAQNTVINLIQEVRFKLTAYYQASDTENDKTLFRHADKVTVTTRDIINLIEGEVGIIFSVDARLLLISRTPVDLTPKVVIRDRSGGEPFDTDVTPYFSAEVLASIEDAKINKNPFKASGSSYDVIVFKLNLPQVEFQVQGFGKTKVSTGKNEGEPVTIVHTGKVDASGNGELQVNPLSGVVPVALVGTVEILGDNLKATVE